MNYVGNDFIKYELNDGTPYAAKVARTVWSGGKTGDDIKGLPIAINGYDRQ